MRVQMLLVSLLMLVDWTEGKCKLDPITPVEQAILDKHNALRRLHLNTTDLCYGENGTDVKFSSELWAKSMAAKKFMQHSSAYDYGTVQYGENLGYQGTTSERESQKDVYESTTQAWYDEILYWNFTTSRNQDNFTKETTGHFTQLVWNGTKQLNCGYAEFKMNNFNSSYVVCQYFPVGNWKMYGYHAANVLPPLSMINDTEINKTANKTDMLKGSASDKDSISVVMVLLSVLTAVRAFF